MEQAKLKEKPSLSLTRAYGAAPEKVWRAWTDPQALKSWFGPESSEVLLAEADVRVGGRFRIVVRTGDGDQHDVSGVYREVQTNRRLVFTWAWKSTPERVSLVTLTLRPAGKGTELTLLHEQFFDQTARDRHESGWTTILRKLDTYLISERQAHG